VEAFDLAVGLPLHVEDVADAIRMLLVPREHKATTARRQRILDAFLRAAH
jgi:hypothetical protein